MKPLYKAIIIDDEPDSVRLLSLELERHCPEVQVVASTTDSSSGLHILRSLKPDLLFLDIEMPVMNGFEVLEQAGDLSFQVIFTTAYDHFAVKAFRFSALDYLVKPIDPDNLKVAVGKAQHKTGIDQEQMDLLRRQLFQSNTPIPEKIAFPKRHGYLFVELKKILYCESDGNYTKIVLDNNETHLVTQNIGEVESTLADIGFYRVHKQYLVHLRRIREFHKNEGTYLIMENGTSVPVARNRIEDFKRQIMKI